MKFLYPFIALLLVCSPLAHSGEEDDGEMKSIALIQLGSFDADLSERLRSYAENNLWMPIELIVVEESDVSSLDEAGKSAAKFLKDNHALGVALYTPSDGIEGHGIIMHESRIAVVNAVAMQPGEVDAETYARRMERQVMRGVGFLLGLGPSPNPQSAMWSYQTLKELDMMARNYDPPWLMKARQKATEKSIKIFNIAEVIQRAGDKVQLPE